MARIAIFSDIHGNLPACQAVLQDIFTKKADKIFCLGDFIGKGPSVNEVLDLCRQYCDASVLGNWEDFLLHGPIDDQPISWYRQILRPDHLEFLQALGYCIEFYLSGHFVRLFHAHPNNVYRRVQPYSPPELLDELLDYPIHDSSCTKKKADIVGYADIHNAFMINRRHHLIFNVGSVGVGHDTPLSTYAMLEGNWGQSSPQKEPYSLTFHRVSYDKAKAIADAQNSPLPFKEFYLREVSTSSFPGREPYKKQK